MFIIKKKKEKGTNSNQNKTGRRHVPGKIAQRFMMSYLLCVSYPLVSFRSRNSSFFFKSSVYPEQTLAHASFHCSSSLAQGYI